MTTLQNPVPFYKQKQNIIIMAVVASVIVVSMIAGGLYFFVLKGQGPIYTTDQANKEYEKICKNMEKIKSEDKNVCIEGMKGIHIELPYLQAILNQLTDEGKKKNLQKIIEMQKNLTEVLSAIKSGDKTKDKTVHDKAVEEIHKAFDMQEKNSTEFKKVTIASTDAEIQTATPQKLDVDKSDTSAGVSTGTTGNRSGERTDEETIIPADKQRVTEIQAQKAWYEAEGKVDVKSAEFAIALTKFKEPSVGVIKELKLTEESKKLFDLIVQLASESEANINKIKGKIDLPTVVDDDANTLIEKYKAILKDGKAWVTAQQIAKAAAISLNKEEKQKRADAVATFKKDFGAYVEGREFIDFLATNDSADKVIKAFVDFNEEYIADLGYDSDNARRFSLIRELGVIRNSDYLALKDNLKKPDNVKVDDYVHILIDIYSLILKDPLDWKTKHPLKTTTATGLFDTLVAFVTDTKRCKSESNCPLDKESAEELAKFAGSTEQELKNLFASSTTKPDDKIITKLFTDVLPVLKAIEGRTASAATITQLLALESTAKLLDTSAKDHFEDLYNKSTTLPKTDKLEALVNDATCTITECKLDKDALDQLLNVQDETTLKTLLGAKAPLSDVLFNHVKPFYKIASDIKNLGAGVAVDQPSKNQYALHHPRVGNFMATAIFNDLVTVYTTKTGGVLPPPDSLSQKDWRADRFNIALEAHRNLIKSFDATKYSPHANCPDFDATKVTALKGVVTTYETMMASTNRLLPKLELDKIKAVKSDPILQKYVLNTALDAILTEQTNLEGFENCKKNAILTCISNAPAPTNANYSRLRRTVISTFLDAYNQCITDYNTKPGVTKKLLLDVSKKAAKGKSLRSLRYLFKDVIINEILSDLKNVRDFVPSTVEKYNKVRKLLNSKYVLPNYLKFPEVFVKHFTNDLLNNLHEINTIKKADEVYNKLTIVAKIGPQSLNIRENLAILLKLLRDVPVKINAWGEPEVAALFRYSSVRALVKTTNIDKALDYVVDLDAVDSCFIKDNASIRGLITNSAVDRVDVEQTAVELQKWGKIQKFALKEVAKPTFEREVSTNELKVPTAALTTLPDVLQTDWNTFIATFTLFGPSTPEAFHKDVKKAFRKKFNDAEVAWIDAYEAKKDKLIGCLIDKLNKDSVKNFKIIVADASCTLNADQKVLCNELVTGAASAAKPFDYYWELTKAIFALPPLVIPFEMMLDSKIMDTNIANEFQHLYPALKHLLSALRSVDLVKAKIPEIKSLDEFKVTHLANAAIHSWTNFQLAVPDIIDLCESIRNVSGRLFRYEGSDLSKFNYLARYFLPIPDVVNRLLALGKIMNTVTDAVITGAANRAAVPPSASQTDADKYWAARETVNLVGTYDAKFWKWERAKQADTILTYYSSDKAKFALKTVGTISSLNDQAIPKRIKDLPLFEELKAEIDALIVNDTTITDQVTFQAALDKAGSAIDKLKTPTVADTNSALDALMVNVILKTT